KTYSDYDKKQLMKLIKPDLSVIRALIRRAIEAGKNVNPIPWDKNAKCWRAEIGIGLAVKEDSAALGATECLRFKTRDELSDEEALDIKAPVGPNRRQPSARLANERKTYTFPKKYNALFIKALHLRLPPPLGRRADFFRRRNQLPTLLL